MSQSSEQSTSKRESVWDYPRPPALESVDARIRVVHNDVTIADSTRAKRVLETSHPPTYYIPAGDILVDHLKKMGRTSQCEWKGRAVYYAVEVGDRRADAAAWTYPNPTESFAELANHFSFYASKMDACYVGDERVEPQEGDFYGGWITSDIEGPFKGAPGTLGW